MKILLILVLATILLLISSCYIESLEDTPEEDENAVKLTNSGNCRTIAWNPINNKIAVVRGHQLWLYDINSDGWQQLTTIEEFGTTFFAPAWSIQGNEIIFCSKDSNGIWTTWKLSLDPRQVTTIQIDARIIKWSPDNQKLLYSPNFDSYNLSDFYIYSFENRTSILLLENILDANWLDENNVIFHEDNYFKSINIDDLSVTSSWIYNLSSYTEVSCIQRSPDEQYFAFRNKPLSEEGSDYISIYKINANDDVKLPYTKKCPSFSLSGEGTKIAYVYPNYGDIWLKDISEWID